MVLVAELESIRTSLTTSNTALQTDLDVIKTRVSETSEALNDAKRYGLTASSFRIVELDMAKGKAGTTTSSLKIFRGNIIMT